MQETSATAVFPVSLKNADRIAVRSSARDLRQIVDTLSKDSVTAKKVARSLGVLLDEEIEALYEHSHRLWLVDRAWRFRYFQRPEKDEVDALAMAARRVSGSGSILNQASASPLAMSLDEILRERAGGLRDVAKQLTGLHSHVAPKVALDLAPRMGLQLGAPVPAGFGIPGGGVLF